MLALRNELGNRHPFIVENGSVICFEGVTDSLPGGPHADEFLGPPRAHVRELLDRLRGEQGYRFESFGDWSARQIALATGLPLERAELAGERLSSEPLQWQDTPERLEAFAATLDRHKLTLTRGGRFHHVLGRAADKGRALERLVARYRAAFPERSFVTVALGDSPNDTSMLEVADIPVVVEAASGKRLAPGKPALFVAPGPAGWNEAVQLILDGRYRARLSGS